MSKPPALPGRLAEFDSYGNGYYTAYGSPKLEAMEVIHYRNKEYSLAYVRSVCKQYRQIEMGQIVVVTDLERWKRL